MPCFCSLTIDNCLPMSNGTTVGCAIFYTLLKVISNIDIYVLVNFSLIVVWLTRFYLSFNALLIECHTYFHSAWENNHAVSAKQRSSCKDVYRVHDNSKVCLCLISMNCKLRNFLISAFFLRIL